MSTVIDATDLILGRLSSIIAKKALLGEKIDIINSENAVITGKKEFILRNYKSPGPESTMFSIVNTDTRSRAIFWPNSSILNPENIAS